MKAPIKPSARHRIELQFSGLRPFNVTITSSPPEPGKFTADEHLRVQCEIEKRAHQFWRSEGGIFQTAEEHWLRAECEVLLEFIWTRTLVPAAFFPREITLPIQTKQPRSQNAYRP
jgi:hypothetical protein